MADTTKVRPVCPSGDDSDSSCSTTSPREVGAPVSSGTSASGAGKGSSAEPAPSACARKSPQKRFRDSKSGKDKQAASSSPRSTSSSDSDDSLEEAERENVDIMNEEGWLAFFTNMFYFKGTVFPAILPQIVLATFIATGTYWLWREKIFKGMSVSGHTALAGLVSTLLVFRNNLSHARYNDARNLAGMLKNNIRTMYHMIHVGIPDLVLAAIDEPDSPGVVQYRAKSVEMMRLCEVLLATIVEHVHGARAMQGVKQLEADESSPTARPPSLRTVGQMLIDAQKNRDTSLLRKSPMHARPLIAFDNITKLAGEMMSKSSPFPLPVTLYAEIIKGAAVAMQAWENMVRIATTPTPFVYRHLVVIMAFTFVFTFPVGFVGTLGMAVIPCTAGIACMFYGLLHLSRELENPFGFDFNDIKLSKFQDDLHDDLVTIHKCTFRISPAPTVTGKATHLSTNANILASTALMLTKAKHRRAVARRESVQAAAAAAVSAVSDGEVDRDVVAAAKAPRVRPPVERRRVGHGYEASPLCGDLPGQATDPGTSMSQVTTGMVG